MTKKKAPKLSKRGKDLLDTAMQSAKDWGYIEDQGVGQTLIRGEANYNTGVGNLGCYLLLLEQQVKSLRIKNSKLKLNISKVKY